jgi:hypothetical protein
MDTTQPTAASLLKKGLFPAGSGEPKAVRAMARIDRAANARMAGLSFRRGSGSFSPTWLRPAMGIDLSLKLAVWGEDERHNDPS